MTAAKTESRNEFLVRQFFETLSTGNLEALRPLFHEDASWEATAQTIPGAGITQGRDKIIDEFLAPVRGLFEAGDPKAVVHRIFSSGEWVAAETTGVGTFRNGNEYRNRYAWIFEIRDDKIYALREYMDSHYILQQLKDAMSAANYDIVTVGSGHNGLVAAAYMAAAGKKVVVLERNAWFGGGVVTRELTVPGYRHDQHSMAHIFIQGNPLLKNDELKLKAKHGLKYVFPDPPMMSVFEDGTTLALYRDRERTCAEIAKFSKRDADAFRWLSEKAAGYLPMIASSLYTTPAPLGATYAMMDQSREGRELWRYMQMSSHDFLCQLFEHDKVRMHFARVAGENLVSPDEKATGLGTFVFVGFLEAYGFGVPVGGSGTLTDSLIASIRANGGEVLSDVDVASIRVKNGRAVGAIAKDGREFAAEDAVIAALHPHDLGKMVEGLAPEVVKAAIATQISEVGCITVHAALKQPLKFRAGSHVKAVMIELLPNKYDTIRKSFDSIRYGEFSTYPLVGLGSLTMFDPSRAPAGAATMHAWDYVPYQRADGRGWDDTKHHYVKRMLNHMENFLDNLADNVLAYHSDSPVDMERTSSSFRRGDLHGIASVTYQSGAHRPTPDLGSNVVPGCERLYLVGPFQHPGGGVFGAGRAAAVRACEDLKIDFEKVGSRA